MAERKVKRSMFGLVIALWRFRGFVLESVKREFRARYVGSQLGALWTLLQPLVMITIYIFVFSELMRARLPGSDDRLAYGIYLCAGILPWTFFTEVMQRTLGMFVENANLLKKSSFPRLALPLIIVLSGLLNLAVLFAIYGAFLVMAGRFPGWVALAFLPVLALQALFSIGLGTLCGTLNVFFRDIGQFVSVVLQLWFWVTPVVYPLSVMPASVQSVIAWNPMTVFVSAYQQIFVLHALPAIEPLAWLAALTLLLLGCTYAAFRALSPELVDEL